MSATITKHLIKLPTGKGALVWSVPEGAQVERGATVATFAGQPVTAPASGRLYRVTPDGITMSGGVPVGRVHEGESGAPIAQKPLRAPTTSQRANSAPKLDAITVPDEAIEARAAGSVQPVSTTKKEAQPSARRSNSHLAPRSMAAIDDSITVLEAGAPVVPKSKGKRRTKHTVYHVTEEQAGRIASLSFLFKSDPDAPNYSESEIVRAAVEHLLGQDRPTIEAILSHNRGREKSAGYGAGWKRPPRGKK